MNRRGLPETVRMKHDLHYVDEIFQQESGAIGRWIPIDNIQPNPNQPRQTIGDLTELKASIQEKGVLEPLIVRQYGAGYQIIAGERRWRACKELQMELVPCIEKNVDDKEMMELALIENLQRKDLTPFEEAEGLQVLADKYHYTHGQIAQVIGKARTSVTETLALNQIPQDVRELCRLADISSKSLLLQVVRQPDVDEMKRLVQRISTEQLTRDDVREEKTRSKRKNKPFIFRSRGEGYELMIRFNKSHATREQIHEALEATLNNLK
ncbi:MAG TPA: ParB/RepB/Spo0J family partition protein [Acidobacteriota bacterium]|nr:ParB/RepB/Spo0J family partition protein [Acidobacteriota bacterium]